MSFAGMILGMLIWMVQTVWQSHSWPLSIFVYPV